MTMTNRSNRRKQREDIFLLLFEKTFRTEEAISDVLSNAIEAREVESDDYLEKKVEDILAHQPELDSRIEKYFRNWSISRISRVSLSALRLAAYEMLYEADMPISVSINEAVEITKTFSTQEDAAFVNGVLGSLAREVGEKPEAKAEEDAQ